MVYLAKFFPQKEVVSLKVISEKEGIPFDFLEKIISETEKAGLIGAKRGVNGGYFLTRAPQKITVKEIMKILDKTTVSLPCGGCQRARKCLTKDVWKKVRNSLDATLDSITLKSLIK
jgi:Rrf2 family protein